MAIRQDAPLGHNIAQRFHIDSFRVLRLEEVVYTRCERLTMNSASLFLCPSLNGSMLFRRETSIFKDPSFFISYFSIYIKRRQRLLGPKGSISTWLRPPQLDMTDTLD